MKITPHDPDKFGSELAPDSKVYDLLICVEEQQLLRDALLHYISDRAEMTEGSVETIIPVTLDSIEQNLAFDEPGNVYIVGITKSRALAFSVCLEDYSSHAQGMSELPIVSSNSSLIKNPEEYRAAAEHSRIFSESLMREFERINAIVESPIPNTIPAEW